MEVNRRLHKGEVHRWIAKSLEPVLMTIRSLTNCIPEIDQIEINVRFSTSRTKLVRKFIRDESGVFQLTE
jgi:hypothetical protein